MSRREPSVAFRRNAVCALAVLVVGVAANAGCGSTGEDSPILGTGGAAGNAGAAGSSAKGGSAGTSGASGQGGAAATGGASGKAGAAGQMDGGAGKSDSGYDSSAGGSDSGDGAADVSLDGADAGDGGCSPGKTSCGGVCVSTDSDSNNCGSCGTVCKGGTACVASVCECPQGQKQCSGTCIDVTGDSSNCGACGTTCAGGTLCVSSACVCPTGKTLCNGTCVDTTSDPANCGSCTKTCASNEVCNTSTCSLNCDPGLTACSGACVSTQTDPAHCGACSNACVVPKNATPTCVGSVCGFTCNGSYKDCNLNASDGCEINTGIDSSNCGACSASCPTGPNATPVCTSGACSITCAVGFADCDGNPVTGCEIDLSTITNCGVCGVTCTAGANAIPVCTSGQCGYVCAAGFADCNGLGADGCEVNLLLDPSNCSFCGAFCAIVPSATSTCTGGACGFSCNAGFLDCDALSFNGCEIDNQTDPQHCGTCSNVCSPPNAVAGCVSGACTVASCLNQFADCNAKVVDGCETIITIDSGNCGGCGFDCSTANVSSLMCVFGQCAPTCNALFGDCNGPAPGNVDDGCETNVAGDVSNCGACGAKCAAGEKCCGGGCKDTTNCALGLDLLGSAAGWQSGGDYVTVKGSGFGPGVKVFFGDGLAAAWAKDANTIITQTPPHPIGMVDITVVQGGNAAILHNAFSYFGGGMAPPWQKKPMAKVRGEDPAIAVMQDGRVLVAGGTTVPDNWQLCLNTAEIYNRVTDTVAYANNAMSAPRMHNAAVTLLTGKVLVVGGAGWGPTYGGVTSNTADLFDPTTDTFAPTSLPLNTARSGIRAVLMADGRVMITSNGSSTAEIYDPITDSFTQLSMAGAHTLGFIARARDGRILVGGGDGGNRAVEVYNPATGTFSPTGMLGTARSMLSAHTLPDSRVIVIGGTNVSAGGVNAPQKTMEFWNPTTGVWTYASVQLTYGRSWHASALVRDGTILVMGGYPTTGSCTPTNTVEQYDPVSSTLTNFATLLSSNTEWTAATLLDGSVIGVGGGACGTPTALPDLDFLAGIQ